MIEVPIGATCCQCNRQRGKSAKPWRSCAKCKGVVCLMCCPAHKSVAKCNKCWQEDWKAEWDEKERVRKATPIQCQGCRKERLPETMHPHANPPICLDCHTIVTNYREVETQVKRKLNARPGLVEVVYGVHSPETDGGKGYAYRDPGLNLRLGDIVMVPASWLDELKGQPQPSEATVVSTYSDYSGETKTIRSLVRRANG